jgi:hypothetical protein
MITRVLHAAGLAVSISVVATDAAAQARGRTLDEFLAQGVLTSADSSSLTHGKAVARTLRTAEARDVAVFGAVQVDVPRSFFMERQGDPHSRARAQGRPFSQPAATRDVQAFAVSDDDLKDLRDCRPGQCGFKLPATDIEHVRSTIDLAAPDARERVAAYARQRMAEYVTDYRARGNAAMIVYDDRGTVRSSDAFAAMLRDSSFVFSTVPSLGEYLLNYPNGVPAGASDVILWSRDQMPNLKPVVRITHEVTYSPSEIEGLTLVAAKQIYANHYFEAGLEVLAAADRASSGSGTASRGITVVDVRRYRFDQLPSGGLLNIRSRVTKGLLDNVATDVARMKRESEAAWAARAAKN